MNDSPADTSRGRSRLLVGGIVIAGVLLLLISTCRGPSEPDQDLSPGESPTTDATREDCARTLASALDGLQPHRLDINSESRVIVDTLNNWLTQCPATVPREPNQADAELRKQLLSENAWETARQDRFQEWDAAHVRNSLLAKAIVETVTRDISTDRERAVELFYYVVRTTQLVPDAEAALPLTPYETLLFGTGSASDRAWTFALLLRQLRLDCVILQPQAPQGQPPYWLLGVAIPGEGIYLFDPRLGLPIAAQDDGSTPLPRQPATLSQVREDDDLLRQFDRTDAKYPLTAESLKTLDVLAIGTSSTFSPRMERLQAELGEPVELYDGLAANQFRATGLHERLVNAGSDELWTAEQVGIWPYPESHWDNDRRMTIDQEQEFAVRLRVLKGPYDIKIKPTEAGDEYVAVKSERTLHEARIEQLVGDFAAAQQIYVHIRLKFQGVQQIALPEVQINALASDMAAYWSAQCQYEQKDFQAAVDSSILYLRKHPGGQFVPSAIYLGSLNMAQLDQRGDAVELLSSESPDAPQFLGNQFLVDRWKRRPTSDATPESTSPSETSEGSGTNNDQTDDEQPDEAPTNETDSPQ